MRLRLSTHSPENLRRGFGAAPPPNGRYGTVLRATLTHDTMPYRPKFLLKIFYLSGTYLMRTLTTEEARNSCEPRLPAGSCADHARLVTLYTDDQLFSDPSLRRGV